MNIIEMIPYLNLFVIPILLYAFRSKIKEIVVIELDTHLRENHEYHVKQQELMDNVMQKIIVLDTKLSQTHDQLSGLHNVVEKLNDRIYELHTRNK
jgi:hypothetical protein